MPVQYQQLLSDLAVLLGAALAALSVILAVVALAQTRAPRGAALAFTTGILLLVAGGFASVQPVTPAMIGQAWSRVISPKPAPGPAPVPEAAPETAPETDADTPAAAG